MPNNERGILGIDAGGTFTDLALVTERDSRVIACAKIPTRAFDMAGTIEKGLDLILRQIEPDWVKAVNLATTHATNAIVEGKLRQSALVLIGYSADSVLKFEREKRFGADLVYQVGGGHDARGDEAEPFDEEGFNKLCDDMLRKVESVALSSFFSVRNPSHELRAKEIVLARSPKTHVTCGHELASDLDAFKRATTAALNAGLIPIIINFLDSVEKMCKAKGLNAPITVVRGDGTLVGVGWARAHPIETVLSGPAASAVGAGFLAGARIFEHPSCVVDMGGTTTDIIYLDRSGRPAVGACGTTIGGHKTLVKSIDIYTFGLGGDSRVRLDAVRKLRIGPGRVRPICSAADEFPKIKDMLRNLASDETQQEPLVVFETTGAFRGDLTDFEKRTLDRLKSGPNTLQAIAEKEQSFYLTALYVDKMEQKGLVSYAGFTPTDALHVLGRLGKWDAEASHIAARILAPDKKEPPQYMCGQICREAARLAAKNILRKNLIDRLGGLKDGGEGDRIIDLALSENEESVVKPDIKANLIGVGAPAWAFVRGAGRMLSQDTLVPENASVAGAAGAAVGTFSQRYAILISPLPNGLHRSHLPVGVKDFECLEEAVEQSESVMRDWLSGLSKRAGARRPVINVRREDEEAWIAGGTRKMHLWTQLYFEAADEAEE
jgi:N-methylhydantoinase A/oxoprolinase/acetone carboxylase beta subunit